MLKTDIHMLRWEAGMKQEELAEKLKIYGVMAKKYFYPLVSANKEFNENLVDNTPIAAYFSKNILCLPLYASLAIDDVDRICDIILK